MAQDLLLVASAELNKQDTTDQISLLVITKKGTYIVSATDAITVGIQPTTKTTTGITLYQKVMRHGLKPPKNENKQP
jgi:hypothetical protein